MSTAFKGEISDMNTPLDDINKILSFQKAQGIKATLPIAINRYRQICLKYGIDTITTEQLINSKFHHFVNTQTIKQL